MLANSVVAPHADFGVRRRYSSDPMGGSASHVRSECQPSPATYFEALLALTSSRSLSPAFIACRGCTCSRPNSAPEPLVVFGGQMLVAKDDDVMFDEGAVDLRELAV